MSIHDYSTAAASNTSVDGINIAENCAPGNINDAIRAVMADVKQFVGDTAGGTATGGSADAYTLTTAATIAAYADGLALAFRANHTNSGAVTVNVDGLGAKAVKKFPGAGVADLDAGDIQSGGVYRVAYSNAAGYFVLLGAGRFTKAEEDKLAGIEASATADQTGAEIKAAYEAEADTNAFTDAEQTKLAGIEAGADVTDATNVQAAGALMDSELASVASVKALDQGVATTDSPSFGDVSSSGTISADFRFEIPAPDASGYARMGYSSSSGSLGLDTYGGAGSAAFLDFDAPDNTTEDVTYRFGRGTNTTGVAEIEVYAHDGTSAISHRIEAGGDVTLGRDGGNLGVGTTSAGYKLTAVEDQDSSILRLDAEHASYTQRLILGGADRAATSAYDFFRFYSSGLTDLEARLSGDGNLTLDGSATGGGADYAEFFEWALAWLDWARDWKAQHGTVAGISVVLDGDQIRPAEPGEEPIGVISANPSVVGDGDVDRWKGKYLRDDFGAYLWEDYEVLSWVETVTETETEMVQATEAQERTREVVEITGGQAVKRAVTETVQVPLFDEFPLVDESGNSLGTHKEPRMIEDAHETTKEVQHSYAADAVPGGVVVPADAERVTQQRKVLNPDFDPAAEYIPRSERDEWDMVGLMGKLRLRKGQPTGSRWFKMRDVSASVEEWLVR